MNLAACHVSGDGVPGARFDPGRLIDNDQYVFFMITFEFFGLVGRKGDREVVVFSEPEVGRF
jgi:hypothetical protein